MAGVAAKIRAWFREAPRKPPLSEKRDAARNLLNEHIDAGLLEGFMRRSLMPEQHRTVLSHLTRCQQCQEAVAVVLLAGQNPSAAAELVLEREKRAEGRGPWWWMALRWTGIALGVFILGGLLYLLPRSESPNSLLGTLFGSRAQEESTSSSDTRFSDWIASSFSDASEKSAASRPVRPLERPFDKNPAGWNSGPASYHDKVERMARQIEVEIPRSALDNPREVGATPSVPSIITAPAGIGQHAEKPTQARSMRRLIVTDAGELMRTVDGGKTWKIITINPGLAFNALAASGGTIWAAGDGGALYRSPDAAEHWQQVILKYHGVPVTSDLLEIRFASTQHGFFKTAEGETWITVDGGNRWILSYRPKAGQ